jgi:hypothetical protein
MSDFRFGCPHCGQRIEGDAAYRGTQINCPACQKVITVPAPVAKTPIADLLKAAAANTPQETKLSSFALISFVCAFGLAAGSIPGIVCGHLARKHFRRDPSLRGKGLAVAGLSISYFFLFASIAFFTVGFFALSPMTGHQLTLNEQATNTPAVLTAQRIDEIKIGDPTSEFGHEMKTRFSNSGPFSGRMVRDARSGGSISYNMKVDPVHPMSLYCTYWGNDAAGRRFDILINETVIATQTLEFNDPGHFFDVEYKIPEKLTHGQNTVTVAFQAYPRKTAGGLYGCQTLTRSGR